MHLHETNIHFFRSVDGNEQEVPDVGLQSPSPFHVGMCKSKYHARVLSNVKHVNLVCDSEFVYGSVRTGSKPYFDKGTFFGGE